MFYFVKTANVSVFSRVSPEIYEAIKKRQAKAKKLTGIEPRISDIVRVMLAESVAREGAR